MRTISKILLASTLLVLWAALGLTGGHARADRQSCRIFAQ